VAPPSPGGDPYALEDTLPQVFHNLQQSKADPYDLEVIVPEDSQDPVQTKEAKQGVQGDLPKRSKRERADEAGASRNLAPSSDVPDMGERKGEETLLLMKQKSRKRGEVAADVSKATIEVREGSRGRSRAAKLEAEPSLATEGNLTVEGGKSNSRKRGGPSGAESVLKKGKQAEDFQAAVSKKSTMKGKGGVSTAGVIDLDSDEGKRSSLTFTLRFPEIASWRVVNLAPAFMELCTEAVAGLNLSCQSWCRYLPVLPRAESRILIDWDPRH
jgi:hypothetical protein